MAVLEKSKPPEIAARASASDFTSRVSCTRKKRGSTVRFSKTSWPGSKAARRKRLFAATRAAPSPGRSQVAYVEQIEHGGIEMISTG